MNSHRAKCVSLIAALVVLVFRLHIDRTTETLWWPSDNVTFITENRCRQTIPIVIAITEDVLVSANQRFQLFVDTPAFWRANNKSGITNVEIQINHAFEINRWWWERPIRLPLW